MKRQNDFSPYMRIFMVEKSYYKAGLAFGRVGITEYYVG